jgi:D-alanine-D-alanine ligase
VSRKIRVGVLFGGQSSEHEVSLASARSVMGALDPEKYEAVPIGITKTGKWLTSGDPLSQLRSGVDTESLPRLGSVLAPDPLREGRAEIVEFSPQGRQILARLGEPLDVIFPVLHGPYGEDGTVQGMLELAGIPYVGAGVLGSAVGMDKGMMKRVFMSHGLPVVPHVLVERGRWERHPEGVQREVEEKLRYPVFAKPANMGSSVGVSKIHGPDEFRAAIDWAARYDRRLLVEQGVDAREVECAVLGNDDPQASVVGEIVPGNEFYDYRAKYVDDNSDLIIPADLPPSVTERVRGVAIEAFKAIDCAGMARVDFFVAREGGEVWLNEINTIPGFTRISMYPKLWEASGLSYSQLVDRLITLALERHEERERNKEALEEPGPGGDLSV